MTDDKKKHDDKERKKVSDQDRKRLSDEKLEDVAAGGMDIEFTLTPDRVEFKKG